MSGNVLDYLKEAEIERLNQELQQMKVYNDLKTRKMDDDRHDNVTIIIRERKFSNNCIHTFRLAAPLDPLLLPIPVALVQTASSRS